VLVGTVETLHGWWTSEMPELTAQSESQTIPRTRVPVGLPTLDDGSTGPLVSKQAPTAWTGKCFTGSIWPYS
jgi:hypothetical protein